MSTCIEPQGTDFRQVIAPKNDLVPVQEQKVKFRESDAVSCSVQVLRLNSTLPEVRKPLSNLSPLYSSYL